MNKRPLIGYPARSGLTDAESVGPRFANSETYARAMAENGGAPVMIPPTGVDDALDRVYTVLDGLLLTGGPDVDPARYGESRHPATDNGDLPMEEAELYLVRRALADGLPILGICRGSQLLNVALGGSLYQDIPAQRGGSLHHAPGTSDVQSFGSHTARTCQGTLLARILGDGEVSINTWHHQAVKDLAPGLVVAATAPDGLVEAIEQPGPSFVVGVQWHPEELYRSEPSQAALFTAFITAAGEFRAKQDPR